MRGDGDAADSRLAGQRAARRKCENNARADRRSGAADGAGAPKSTEVTLSEKKVRYLYCLLPIYVYR